MGPLLDVVNAVALGWEEFDEVEAFRTAGLWAGVICWIELLAEELICDLERFSLIVSSRDDETVLDFGWLSVWWLFSIY